MKSKLRHTFVPGDKWLYFKIYCGTFIADELLKNKLNTLVLSFQNKKLIKKWFFIRYSDPEHHLRIRFELTNVEYLGEIIISINKALKEWVDDDLIWKISIDTYQREIQRYLQEKIIYSEEIFFINSEIVRRYLNKETNLGDSGPERLLFCLWHLNTILDVFGLNLQDKLKISENYFNSYAVEFRSNRQLKKQLGVKYNKYLDSIKLLFDDTSGTKRSLRSKFKLLEKPFYTQYKRNAKKITTNVDEKEIIKSHMHMFVNRLFITKQRKHELVIYYFLTRYYSYKIATSSKKFKINIK